LEDTAGRERSAAIRKNRQFAHVCQVPQEIDTRFYSSNHEVIDGPGITWTDPTGASNRKWSYYNQSLDIINEAHVEAVSTGVNLITVANQPGCTVNEVVSGKIRRLRPADGAGQSHRHAADLHAARQRLLQVT
jgi:hypothetical protein